MKRQILVSFWALMTCLISLGIIPDAHAGFFSDLVDKISPADSTPVTEEEKAHPQAYAYYNSGVKKHNSKDYQGAVAEFTRAIESYPEFADAYKSRGDAKGWLDDSHGWMEDINRAISLNPNNAAYYADRADAKSYVKDWSGAVADYDKAVSLEPHNQNFVAGRDKAKVNLSNVAEVGGISFPMIPVPDRDYPSIPNKKYELGKTEVTQAQWLAVMGENPSHFSKCGDDCPVENVSWEDTKRFLQQLNKKTGKEYRLPTGEEWDYACNVKNLSYDYCGGYDLDKLGWTENNSGGETHPVAGKKPNAWGFYDMTGNVWEWVEDKSDEVHDWRVLRGGSWGNKTPHTYHTINSDPTYRLYSVGFRLARTLP
jgi:tetratricopeptide (TPR) repeat protein